MAAAAWVLRRPVPPSEPLEISVWYWDSPFHLSPAEAAQWRSLGVRQMFVRAGTFVLEGKGARLTLPQTWEKPPGVLRVQMVFNFDYSLVRHFGETDNAALAADVARAVRSERERIPQIAVAGVQFDFDCPTRRLPRYADLLRRIRTALALPALEFSITALPTWYESGAVQQVLDAVDFAVPQYYEAQMPESREHFAPVSRLTMAERGLRQAESHGRPFYVGLPAYGHALMTDEQGKVLGLYRGMTAEEAAHHPAFQLVRNVPLAANGKEARSPEQAIGETLLDFVAVRPAPDGRGKGYHLLYDLPDPELLRQHLAMVRANRPAHCRGVILFRRPAPDETMTLPLPTLAAVLQGRPAAPDLRVSLKISAAPWELIETGRSAKRPPLELSVSLTNTGAGSTLLAPEALTLTLRFNRSGLSLPDRTPFETTETYAETAETSTAENTSGLRSISARANTIRVTKWHLSPGETVFYGPIRLPSDGATQVSGNWTLRDPDGFHTRRGTIPAAPLVP